MKYPLLLMLLAVSLFANAQNNAGMPDEKKTELLLNRLRLQQATEEDRAALQQIAAAVQSTGQWLDENRHDYKKSLQNIDKAIVLYDALADTLNIAFNKKYKGHLLVRLGKPAQAKAEMRAAINLYRLKNTGAGVASSQFDLARVFEFENKTDSVIYYAGLSRSFWQLQENNLQIFVINNMMVYHLLQLNQTEKAEAVYRESQLLLTKQAVHWQVMLDFYFTSMLLFRQTNDMANAGRYREVYAGKKAELQRQGIAAKSYYEADAQ